MRDDGWDGGCDEPLDGGRDEDGVIGGGGHDGSGGKSSMSVMTGGGEVREYDVATQEGGGNESDLAGVGMVVCC